MKSTSPVALIYSHVPFITLSRGSVKVDAVVEMVETETIRSTSVKPEDLMKALADGAQNVRFQRFSFPYFARRNQNALVMYLSAVQK